MILAPYYLYHQNMEKIKRYRPIQSMSFETFFNMVTDKGICKYCSTYGECLDIMGEDNLEALSGNGCGAFDNTVENIKKIYLIEECQHIGT